MINTSVKVVVPEEKPKELTEEEKKQAEEEKAREEAEHEKVLDSLVTVKFKWGGTGTLAVSELRSSDFFTLAT